MKNPKEAQQKYMELQMLAQHIKQAQMQVEALEEQSQQLLKTKITIETIAKTENDNEMLFPVGQGVFAKGKLSNNKEVILNVGAGVAVKKQINDSVAIVDQQIKEIKDFQQELIAHVQDDSVKAKRLEKEIQALLG